MSESLCYRPLNKYDYVKTGRATGRIVRAALEKAFYSEVPFELTEEHISKLEAMAAAFGDDEEVNPYDQIAKAVEKHGAIEIFRQV